MYRNDISKINIVSFTFIFVNTSDVVVSHMSVRYIKYAMKGVMDYSVILLRHIIVDG